jgi:SAM-dependent methyltransferase
MFNKLKQKIKIIGHNIVYDGMDRYFKIHNEMLLGNNSVKEYTTPHFCDQSFLFNPVNIGFFDKYQEKIEYYKNRYGMLEHHIEFLNLLTRYFNLEGIRVLEIGGSNFPRELIINNFKVEKWVCIDKPWATTIARSHEHYDSITMLPLMGGGGVSQSLEKDNYLVFNMYAEDISDEFQNFDLCISCCSFEHIKYLPTALKRILGALKPGGRLFSRFGPIFSGHCGSHFMLDDLGIQCGFQDVVKKIPPYTHLLLSYEEIAKMLYRLYPDKDIEVLQNAAYEVKYGSNRQVNQLFYEDYLYIMSNILFSQYSVTPYWTFPVSAEIWHQLHQRYPSYQRFDVAGVEINAVK